MIAISVEYTYTLKHIQHEEVFFIILLFAEKKRNNDEIMSTRSIESSESVERRAKGDSISSLLLKYG